MTTQLPLVLPAPLRRQIESEGAAAYPNECCGILIGRDMGGRRLVERLMPGTNAFQADEQYHRFSIDPRQQINAEREASAEGKAVLGFYHSHPDHPARPSEYDREHAWPFYSYVIVAVVRGRPADMTSWVLDDQTNQFLAQEIRGEIEEDDMTSDYAHPEALVSTGWVAEHLKDPKVKIVEVDVDTTAYDKGHIRGAIGWNWQSDLNDRVQRDVVDPRTFAELCRRSGIGPDDTVVFYGDNNNWFAAWALWQFKYHGHRDARLMNGGRKKWELEKRELVTDPPRVTRSNYPVPPSDESVRSYRREVEDVVGRNVANLIDVRSPDEFTGKILAPEALIGKEGCQRGGHIPGAKNIPWAKAANDDGTFKSPEELRKLYVDAGVDFNKPTIAYCRIGERSSHTWFVLTYLLGVNNVKNYDGSWTEWGNLVGAPIETGEGAATAMPNVRCQ